MSQHASLGSQNRVMQHNFIQPEEQGTYGKLDRKSPAERAKRKRHGDPTVLKWEIMLTTESPHFFSKGKAIFQKSCLGGPRVIKFLFHLFVLALCLWKWGMQARVVWGYIFKHTHTHTKMVPANRVIKEPTFFPRLSKKQFLLLKKKNNAGYTIGDDIMTLSLCSMQSQHL